MKNNKFVCIVLIPIFCLIVVFLIAPLFYGLGISMFDYNPLRADNPFIGAANYVRLFHDTLFYRALAHMLVFVGVTVTLNIIVTLILAQLISSLPWNFARGLFRTVLFLPCVAPMVGTSLVWRNGMFATKNGLVNHLLGYLGIPAINWLGDASVVMVAMIIFTIWADIGYNTVLFCAGLDGIPKDFSEAAQIDGAGPVRRFIYITLPLLGRTFIFVLMMTLISHFQMFVQFMVLAQRGAPNNAATVLTLLIYKEGFSNQNMGYASAIAVILFLVIMVVTVIQRRVNRVDWGY